MLKEIQAPTASTRLPLPQAAAVFLQLWATDSSTEKDPVTAAAPPTQGRREWTASEAGALPVS